MGGTAVVTINWLTRYETGIAEIDAQHFRLFEVVNELIEAFRRGDPNSQAAEVIDYLVNFTEEHFKTEEAWMERQHFPGREAHRKEHRDFMSQIFELKGRFDSGESLTLEVTVLLADWLEYHINDGDQAFAQYTRGSDAR
jgi:hemerythrin-like metal-binding protein